ncbi:hypothetical protein PIB30_086642, partial [Stylosanthes scabra]|nr:hypothetical protein [Stylosanthes scabra]
GRGRGFPARVLATASRGFCPIPVPTEKILRLWVSIRGVFRRDPRGVKNFDTPRQNF